MNFNRRPMGLSLLALALATGSSLLAQEATHQTQPDPSAAYKLNYKRFTREGDEKVEDEAWLRHQWFLERMGGELGPDFYQRLVSESAKERAKYPHLFPRKGVESFAAVTQGAWVNLGPTSSAFTQNGVQLTKVDSGRARTILPDPTDPNTVYFLNAGGGLWKTTNFGSPSPTWTPTTDFVGSTAGGSADFGRTSSVLYFGAGDSFDGGVGGFVCKSTDSAATWGGAVFLTGATKIHNLKVDTSVGATTANDVVLVGTNAGLFRSTNGGASFTSDATLSGKAVWTLVKTSAGWLASTVTGSNGALYISTDLGATWNPITTPIAGMGRATLGIGAAGDSIVYCFAANTGNAAQLDLFRSTNGGQSWTALGLGAKVPTNTNGDQSSMDVMHGQAFYNHMLLVDPSDVTRNTVFLGGNLSSVKSVDGGVTWTVTSNWLAQFGLPYIHADFHAAAFSNAGGLNRIFFGTDGGLFTSTDGGSTWDDTKNNGLATHLIYALAVNPNVTGSALIGLQDNGTRTRVTSPSPTSTFNQIRGGDGFGVGWAPASGYSMSSYVYNAIRRSTTNPPIDQSNWASFVTGLPAQTSANFNFVTPIISSTAAADPSGTAFFTYSTTGVGKIFQSNATGWTTIGTAGTGGIGAGHGVRAVSHGIGVHPSDLTRIAAAAASGYILITTNGGGAWTETFLGSTGTDGQNIGWRGFNANVAWASNLILYACSEATIAGAAHVARTADGGTTWTRADAGLPDVPVTKVVVDPGDATGNTVYAATWLGVYRTTDGGTSWTLFGTGLPQGRVSDIFVAPDSSFIRVSTWGRGVWEMVINPVLIAPTSAVMLAGDTATFQGTVNGGGTVNFTATGGTVTPGGVFTAGNTPGTFTVTATNGANGAQSASATVTVQAISPVAITTQPVNRSVAVGQPASFSVAATGTGPLAFQWKKNGVAIAGAISSTYTTPSLALIDTGSTYSCDVTGRSGTLASGSATVTVMGLGTAIVTNVAPVGGTPLTDFPAAAVNIPFTVSGVTGNVGEVTFSLYLTHTWVGDLKVSLISPDGTEVILANGVATDLAASNTGAAFGTSCGTYTVFADAGSTPIQAQTSASLPLVGTFKPTAPLYGFSGKSPNGVWNLRILDQGTADTGTFQCGSLSIKPLVAVGPSFDINGDAATDAYDLLEFLKLFGSTAPADLSKADFNNDGQINDADLTLLLNAL
ncbi:MAG TPA: proprotein convertase P-domain-containing protein [Holophagaceae bacterium]|nr:proprotein convertase P-domain-containing protein [Holophagaceae bacterium]